MNKLSLLLMVLSLSIAVYAWPGTQITSDAEDHYSPESAAGQNAVVYTCGNTNICSDVRGGGSETIISSTSNAYHPDINSEGEIAYGQPNGSYNVIYTYISGVESQLNTGKNNSYNPDMCPDGDTIAYYRKAGDARYHIFKVVISTNVSTQLTSGAFIDGEGVNSEGIIDCGDTDIVFTRCTVGYGYCNIAKVPIAGGAVTNLTTDDGSNSFDTPQWNVDYTKVVFTGNWNPTGGNVTVFTVDANGANFANITTGWSNYFWPFTCPNATYAVRRDAGFNYYISQIQPSILDDLDTTVYDYPSCDAVASFDIFYSKNDGSNDQITQEHFADPPGPGLVPEFSTITLLLAALIALGGIFAFRRYR